MPQYVEIGEETIEKDFPGHWYWARLPYDIRPTIFGDDVYPRDHIDGVVLWCAAQFGAPQSPEHRIERRWRKSGFTTFHFRKVEDRTWFLLRWS